MITATNLYKTYGKIAALNNVSFAVDDGEIFGVIGPDGAGKTTLFRILASLILPDRGAATLNGYDVVKDFRQIRHIIGYMPGRFSLYQDLSVEENLQFFATVFHTSIQENYGLIKDIYQQIEPFAKRRADALSGGMKQKLALSCALIHKPQVLILDEPTTGVDPVSRKEFWDILGKLKKEGITILVSTAYMDEAGRCDRIALMRDGKFIATDTPNKIIESYAEELWSVEGSRMSQMLSDIRQYPQVKTCFAFGDKFHVTVQPHFQPSELYAYLTQKGCQQLVIERITPTVENCFMALAGK